MADSSRELTFLGTAAIRRDTTQLGRSEYSSIRLIAGDIQIRHLATPFHVVSASLLSCFGKENGITDADNE